MSVIKTDNIPLSAGLIVGPAVLGAAYALFEAFKVSRINLTGPSKSDVNLETKLKEDGVDHEEQLKTMITVSTAISVGANAYLYKQFQVLAIFIVIVAVALCFIDVTTGVTFVIGALTSLICGFIGMRIAVYSNIRTAHEAWKELNPAFVVALRAGAVMGFSLVSIGVLVMFALLEVIKAIRSSELDENASPRRVSEHYVEMMESITGYGLGGSCIALFARVGGGIYTKAADVGADLSGKNDFGIDEDDPRNPACIADNVGDNVGDIAGMGADLFGSLAESTCAALLIGATSPTLAVDWAALMFPLQLTSVGSVVGIVTLMIVRTFYKVNKPENVETALKLVLVLSTILMTGAAYGVTQLLPAEFVISFKTVTPLKVFACVAVGLWAGLLIGLVTEYYTSHSYSPVRKVAETQKTSAATGIISGLALGYESCLVPVFLLGASIGVSHACAHMYGVAIAAIGMLGTLALSLTIDAFGPIADNAGGIAEMAQLGPEVRARTDALDAAGNTTAAIGKGFAIGSAALVSLALFGAFCVRAEIGARFAVKAVDVLDPWTFIGVLVGAMLPFLFSAMTMKSVGEAAIEMVQECLRQFPGIMNGTAQPDYERCISISTTSALKEMIAPGLLVVVSPIFFGLVFGKNCTAGLLIGILTSGVQMAISASNTGGAWDNAKKYIEAGGLPGHPKGSPTHKNAVTGDTVGDPLKDTSGPSLNILVKLSAVISVVIGGVLHKNSNATGGPKWLTE